MSLNVSAHKSQSKRNSPADLPSSKPKGQVLNTGSTAASQVNKPASPAGILPVQSSTEGRLTALELVVNSLAPQIPGEVKAQLAALAKRDWTKAS